VTIPKIIHYCWFGSNTMPQNERKCIELWSMYFPDYEKMLWNEETFDVNAYSFTKEAYASKKYAFVSDFVRVKVLFEYGGLYLDTDVEVLKNFEYLFEDYQLICGFETSRQVGTAVIACVRNNSLINQLYNFYQTHHFKTKYGDNIAANVTFLTNILQSKGLKLGGEQQILEDILVTNRNLFYPKKKSEYNFRITEQTVAIHRCSNSWMTVRQKRRGKSWLWRKIIRPIFSNGKKDINKIFGKDFTLNLEILIRKILR